VNSPNLGLSKTLNKAFGMARTPYVLTCHCDCEFGHDGYVAGMLQLLETHPQAGAITGQPVIPPGKSLPLAEKINLVANLQDIFPAAEADLVPVGFAEGRCDAFRVDAMRAVGGYDTNLRLAGEDQVIAAKMRDKGYEVYIAPRMTFHLSVSEEQDTLGKLAKHMRLYGRAHPYVLLMSRGTQKGLVGKHAGGNRSSRTLLRAQQLAATAVYGFAAVGILTHLPGWLWGGPALGLLLAKIAFFSRHFREVKFTPAEYVIFFSFQPYLDLSYTAGVVQGLWLLARGHSGKRPIS
jgi:cellulose synthase/poly-beta-1,6-N-acetylglucosamine synthase-like glycosyltransferase